MAAVVVIEPHALLRLGILQHLADVLPASRLEGVDYAALSEHPSDHPENDLVLLSVPSGEDVIKLIDAAERAYAPKWMLLLSDVNPIPLSWQHLPAIVAGYIPRNASPDVLTASIRLVLVGGQCFQSSRLAPVVAPAETALPACASRKISPASLIGRYETDNPPQSPENTASTTKIIANEAEMLHITPRQYEVLVLLARGYPIKTVSRQLNISVATAKAHTETLYQRLDAHNRNEAVYTAVSRGATLGWQQLGSDNGNEPSNNMRAA